MATLSYHPLLHFTDRYSEQGTGLHPLQSPTTSFCLTLRVGLNTSPRFCLAALEKGAAGGQASHLTSFSCFGHGQIPVLEASFLPHLPLTFWTHTAVVVAGESLTKDLHTQHQLLPDADSGADVDPFAPAATAQSTPAQALSVHLPGQLCSPDGVHRVLTSFLSVLFSALPESSGDSS